MIDIDLTEMLGSVEQANDMLNVLKQILGQEAAEVEPKLYVKVAIYAWEAGFKEGALSFAEEGIMGQSSIS